MPLLHRFILKFHLTHVFQNIIRNKYIKYNIDTVVFYKYIKYDFSYNIY